MLSIKTKVMIIADKYNFKDIESLIGIQLDEDQTQEGIQQNTYKISEQLKNLLESKSEDGTPKFDITKLYIWSQEDLNNQGLGAIKVNTNRFYIIYYNLEDTNSCEIYSSEGYNSKYSLTELKDM